MKLYEMVTKENWRQGYTGFGYPNNPSGCILHQELLGVLSGALTDYDIPAAREKIVAAIATLYPERLVASSVMFFNDDPRTTFEDVQRVLKFADV